MNLFRVVTLNTWKDDGPWRERWKAIEAELVILRPVLIAFQEVIQPEILQNLSETLNLPHCYFPASESGLAFLSQRPIQTQEIVFYHDQAPKEEYRRAFLAIKILWDKEPLWCFNTHLSWRPKDGLLREKQVSQLLQYVVTHCAQDSMIAMGDFNATPDASEMLRMTQKARWVDAYRQLCHPKPGYTWDNRNPFADGHNLPNRRLDYFFYQGKGFEANTIKIVFDQPKKNELYPSDHFGLCGEFGYAQ